MDRPVRRNSNEDAARRSAQRGAAIAASSADEPTQEQMDLLTQITGMGGQEDEGVTISEREAPERANTDFRSLLSMKEGYGDDEFIDPELENLNNPDVTTLHDPPLIGGKGRKAEIFGEAADTLGRVTSPKLLTQASNMPTAAQFRIWRWENGVPSALGAIDAEASEDDFIRQFYQAMPEEGDGRFQFRFRPVDIRGVELGKEFTMTVSEFHETLLRLRAKKKREAQKEQQPQMMFPYQQGGNQPIIVQPPPAPDNGAGQALEEVGRMFENAVETERSRTDMYRQSLEEERARLRDEEKSRAEERMSFASRSAEAVQKMTERLMAADRDRSKEQLDAQGKQGQLLLATVTTVFQQQQEAARAQAERLREADMARLQMDREFFDRQRQLQEEQRLREKEDNRLRMDAERSRLEMEQKRMEAQRVQELEMLRMETQRREADAERRRQVDKEDLYQRMERDREESRRAAEAAREERDRHRMELEDRRRQDAQDWERRRAIEKEEADRKEREYRDRAEREQREFQTRIERDRLEMENRRLEMERKSQQDREDWERKIRLEREETDRRESLRREEMNREADRRREEMQVQLKQMEMAAQRDREHQERLMHMAQLERDSQREALAARERAETAARELAEKERARQHAAQVREMELSKERDREHAERMLAMQKQQTTGGFGQIGEMLGMETPELLTRIFGGGGGGEAASGSAWSEAIPKMIGSIADIGKAALAAKMAMPSPEARRPRPQSTQQPAGPQSQQLSVPAQPERSALPPSDPNDPLVQIPTPEGLKVVKMSVAQAMGFRPPPGVERSLTTNVDLPDQGSIPQPKEPVKLKRKKQAEGSQLPDQQQTAAPKQEAKAEGKSEAPAASQTKAEEAATNSQAKEPEGPHPLEVGKTVNTGDRAKSAGMKLLEIGKARKSIRALADKLRKSPEENWSDIVIAAIMENVGIFDYIQAVSLYAALAEADVAADFADRIQALLRSNELVPADLTYTEQDYVAKQMAKESAE